MLGYANFIESEALELYVAALTDPHTGIPLGNRRVRLTTYRNCFTGAAGVAWFMDNMEVRFRFVADLTCIRESAHWSRPSQLARI